MSFNVSGLASGIDTNGLVEALMFSERAAVRRLESSKASEDSALRAWGDVESKLKTLETAIDSIRDGTALGAALAESTDESILRVSTQGSALPGSYALRVNTLAAAQQVTSEGLAGGTSLVGAGTATVSGGFASIGSEVDSHALNDGTYTLTISSIDTDNDEATVIFDGVEQTVSTVGGTMTVTADDGGTLTIDEASGESFATGSASITVVVADGTTTANNLAASLNAAGGPVRAQIIDTGDGSSTSYRLVITSRDTGLDNAADIDFSALSLFSGGLTTLRDADDASVTLGDGGLTITRPTNTIGDLFDGLAIDLVGVDPDEDVEIVVSADLDSQVASVSAVADAATGVIRALNNYSSYDVDAQRGGPLVGSFTARSVGSEVSQAMSTVASSGSFVLLSQIGITIQNDGTYSVDDAKLRSALTTDPDGVEQMLLGDASDDDDGVLDVINNTVEGLLGTDGRILTAKSTAEQNIDGLDDAIASQEVRLVAVEERYIRQFAALESLIGQLQSQSNYLAGVLGAGAAA